MKSTEIKKREYDPKIKNQLSTLGERIRIAIAPTSQRAFAKTWKGSFVTLNHYINGKSIPGIHDLIEIANLTNTDLLWLLTGQYYSQTDWLTANQSVEICSDNSMSPTINEHTPVVIETVNIKLPSVVNNVYCLESSQGRIFRRLQWDEEKQGFWLRCDNHHFEQQFNQAPNIVGKVVRAFAPVI